MDNARELAADLLRLLRREQGAMADFLADFDDRRLWLKLGHSSLFTFLHRELGLSKGASHFRKTAAELIRRYPEVVEPLRDGRLCISSVSVRSAAPARCDAELGAARRRGSSSG